MIRIRVPGGNATSRQLRRLAEVADDYGRPRLSITTRGGLELHDVPPVDVPAVRAALAEVGLGDAPVPDFAPLVPDAGLAPLRPGRSTVAAIVPMGQLPADAALVLANLAEDFGAGIIRLTPERNAEIPGVRAADVTTAIAALEASGLHTGDRPRLAITV